MENQGTYIENHMADPVNALNAFMQFEFSTNVPEERKEIFAAFVKAWGATETPKHNKTVEVRKEGRKLYDFKYTDLAGIIDAVRKPFADNNLAIMQHAFTQENEKTKAKEVRVETMFLHSSGHFMKTRPIVLIASNNLQDLGGQITYMKRYSLSAALGLATEADNDAAAVDGSEINQNPPVQPPKNQQQNEQTVRNSEATAGSAAASDAQKKKIHAMLNNIGKLQGYDPAKVYERIQEVYKTDTKIDDLGKQAASSLIRLLADYEIEDPTKRKNLY